MSLKKIVKFFETTGWSHFVKTIKFSYKIGKFGIKTIYENKSEILKILKIFDTQYFFLMAKISSLMVNFALESLWEYRKEL